jgi:uncharacterized protein YecE (DUF72 family)
MANVYVGTCSWKYPSWEGLVYSSRELPNYLIEYSRKYRSVEVDQWFWSLGKERAALPRPETVAEYDASTPSAFRFIVKCPNTLTLTHHHSKKGEPLIQNEGFLDIEFFLRFIDSLSLLMPKVGLLVFQFEYLNRDKMASKDLFKDKLAAFLNNLPADLPYAVEIRNPRWIDEEWFNFLAEHHVAPVLLQGYWMADVAETLHQYGDKIGDILCIRLHGEDREGMEERTGEDWSKIVRPKDNEISRIMNEVGKLAQKNRTIYLNINNHYEGSAPLTMEKVTKEIQGFQ